MNSLLSICLLGLLPSVWGSACPNNCNNHGSCGTSNMCECYRNWFGADCSQRICSYGHAFVDSPVGDLDGDLEVLPTRAFDPRQNNDVVSIEDVIGGQSELFAWQYGYARAKTTTPWNEAHFYRECSNKGTCNRATGLCNCFPGYEGEGCIRSACPNKCSGHGMCRTIADYKGSATYSAWDLKKTQMCVCDSGYEGPDCSLRSCPGGADPVQFAHVVTNSVQAIVFRKSKTDNVDKKIFYTITTTDEYGDEWTTRLMSVDYTSASAPSVGDNAALIALVNNVNKSLSYNDGISDPYTWGRHNGKTFPSSATGLNSHFVDSQRFRLDAKIELALNPVCGSGTGATGLCFFIQNQNHGKQTPYRVDYWYHGKNAKGSTTLISGRTTGFTANVLTGETATADLDIVTVHDVQHNRNWLLADGDVVKTFINKTNMVSLQSEKTNLDACSNRGLCDYTTGLCGCFAGYTGVACTEQNSIAYTY